jgi:hypothetical protein
MQADIELRLFHDGNHWVVQNDSLKASGETFRDLDEDLKHKVIDTGAFSAGASIKVFMGFDFDTIPTWLRQYHTHYFNRLVNLDL